MAQHCRAQSKSAALLLSLGAMTMMARPPSSFCHATPMPPTPRALSSSPSSTNHRPRFSSKFRGGSATAAPTTAAVPRLPPRSSPRHEKVLRAPPEQEVVAPAATPPADIPPGTASIASEIFNLIKCIVGAGVLGLPAGIATYGNAPSAILPALVLLVLIGSLSAYSFQLIGLVLATTRTVTYRQAWKASVGPRTSWLPALAIVLVTTCSVLTYSMILADSIPRIVQVVTGLVLTRTQGLLGITLTALLPLCLMRQLSSLAPFSLVGILGMVYTSAIMLWRWESGAYSLTTIPSGKFVADLPAHYVPLFGTAGWKAALGPQITILIAMMSTSFMAHYNAPKFYWELRNNTLPRYNRVVALSFAGAMVLMAATAAAGFGTFGANVQPLVLNNYAVSDAYMGASRMAVALSLICSYPLAFVGVREGWLDLLQVPVAKRNQINDVTTVALLSIVTALAYSLKDIGIILALGGATWGNALIYVFPALMFVQTARRFPELQSHIPRAAAMGGLGLVLGVLGTHRALSTL